MLPSFGSAVHPRRSLRGRLVLLGLLAIAFPSPRCAAQGLTLWRPPPAPPGAGRVERFRDVAYAGGPGTGDRHRLDLFLPAGKKDFPVVVLVHGGGWVIGDNRCCGLYSSVGEFLARRGVAAALPNYQLSPAVKHPEHVKDVARAFAWTVRNVKKYGGRPDRVFLAGHSAGGHLVALLATDEKYLRAEKLGTRDVRGVIAVSGVYNLPPGDVRVTLGGRGPRAASLDAVFPLRGEGGWDWARQAGLPGVPLSLNVYGPAFGADPRVRKDASPLEHVRAGLPPFLIVYAENDLPTLPDMAVEFHRALIRQKVDARVLRVEKRNHNSVLFRAIEPGDPAARAILDFIRRHG